MPIMVDTVNVYIEYDTGAFVETITDDWGDHDVYKIASFYVLNRSDVAYRFSGYDAHARYWELELAGGDDLAYNIPTPARPDSYPLTVHWTRV